MRLLNIQRATSFDERNIHLKWNECEDQICVVQQLYKRHVQVVIERTYTAHTAFKIQLLECALWRDNDHNDDDDDIDDAADNPIMLLKYNIFVSCLFHQRWSCVADFFLSPHSISPSLDSIRLDGVSVVCELWKTPGKKSNKKQTGLATAVNALHSVYLSFSPCRRIPNDIIDQFISIQFMKRMNRKKFVSFFGFLFICSIVRCRGCG